MKNIDNMFMMFSSKTHHQRHGCTLQRTQAIDSNCSGTISFLERLLRDAAYAIIGPHRNGENGEII